MPEGGWEPQEKRQRVSWAVNKIEEEKEEDDDRLEELKANFAVPDDVKEAVARHLEAEAAKKAAEEAAAPPPVFAKRRIGGAKATIRKKPTAE